MEKKVPSSKHEQVLQDFLDEHGLKVGSDRYVRWQPSSVHHPRNWQWQRKCFDIGLIMFLEMFMSCTSTVGTAVSARAHLEYGIGETLGNFVFTSIYLLGEAIGGMLLPPISETFGRKSIYAFATLLHCAFDVVIAAVPSSANGALASVIIGRLLSGIAGSTPATVAPGSLEDIYSPAHRVWGVFAWTTASNVGVLLGPIYSSYIVARLGWRWVFWIAAIVNGITFFFSLALRESRTTLLLQQKLVHLIEKTGDKTLRIQNPDEILSFRNFFQDTLFRPTRLLFTEPIVMLCSALNAISFAMIYGLTEALTVVYEQFGFDAKTSSLAFIPITIGLFICIPARILDDRRLCRLTKAQVDITPEAKIRSFAFAVPALAIGLWAFAWTIPPIVHIHWIVSMLALVPVGFAINDLDTVLCGYLADSYCLYAASAFSALSLLRSVLAAAFPLFAGTMYRGLGSNAAASIFAAIATLFCVSPFVLLRYGKKLRERSEFAQYSMRMAEASFSSGDTIVEQT
ncbi:MFS multidrug transporter [Saccharata proteae CBS 121410]|uniref:MFS multidrug transporter n=1 Tax=Saccharata proteae CBS 121410 TaxID=1314787 RepID=A0A9P4HY24_9PEZI|nr:MFS multidrug transporter [Saccharata proteae CBS 121410]